MEEAATEARTASDFDLLGLADLFLSHDQGDLAGRLMLGRAEKTTDTRVLEWLKKYYQSHGGEAAALELAERIFRLRPSLEQYRELRELGQSLGRWDNLRPKLLAFLAESRNSVLLIRIRLEEGEIDRALELLEPWQQRNYFIGGGRARSPLVVGNRCNSGCIKTYSRPTDEDCLATVALTSSSSRYPC